MEHTTQEFSPCWVILEIFGHARFAGLVGEQAIAGDKLLRLDIPAIPEGRVTQASRYHPTEGHCASNGSVWRYDIVFAAVPSETKFFGVKAIYAMTPTTEEKARAEVSRLAQSVGDKRIDNVTEIPDPRVLALPPLNGVRETDALEFDDESDYGERQDDI